ncbi:hypothetical protein, partial [Enterocloster asparagiformis]|uniref:hypothetical protein n=1 Tax=Enterocloster asparagiformis TaxID=333367 RepID=UPI001A9B8360
PASEPAAAVSGAAGAAVPAAPPEFPEPQAVRDNNIVVASVIDTSLFFIRFNPFFFPFFVYIAWFTVSETR